MLSQVCQCVLLQVCLDIQGQRTLGHPSTWGFPNTHLNQIRTTPLENPSTWGFPTRFLRQRGTINTGTPLHLGCLRLIPKEERDLHHWGTPPHGVSQSHSYGREGQVTLVFPSTWGISFSSLSKRGTSSTGAPLHMGFPNHLPEA